MAEVDGRVYIDTEIQTDGFEAGSKDLEAAARRMAKTVKNIGDSAKISLQKQTDAFVKQNQMLAQQKAKVEALKSEYEQLSNQKIETDEFKEIGKQIETDIAKLNRLEQSQEEFLAVDGSEDSKAYKRRQLQIEELRNSIQHAKSEQQELLSSGGAYKNADASAVQKKLATETGRLSLMNDALGTSYLSLKQKVSSYGGETKKLIGIKGRLISSLKKLGNSIKNVGKKMLGLNKKTKSGGLSMKRMLGTSLLMGVAFQAFSAILQGMTAGMNNLAQYSKDTNADLSALKSSLTQLKNSFATAFAPILSVVTPALTWLINLLSKAITYVGMFFAALTGKKSFTKAVAVQEDYAASLGNTASGAEDAEKAMEGYLSPLDEVNKMEKEDSSGSGSGLLGTGTISPSEMFETEEIDSSITSLVGSLKGKFAPIIDKFKEFAIRIKESTSEWFEGLNWQPLLDSIDRLLVAAEPLIGVILDGLGWAYENILLPFGKWTIEEALPVAIDTLSKGFELLTVIIEALSPVFMYLWENVLAPFGQAAGEIIVALLEMFGGLADFLIGVFTGDWDRAFSGIQTVLGSFQKITESIFGFIQKSIIAPFDEFLGKAFAKDWTEQFGIMGEGLNGFFSSVKRIWSGIKDIFNGIVTFVRGVFAGDWKQAWEGIKQIIAGIFEKIVGVVTLPINGIIACLNALISGIVAGINTIIKGINKIKFDVPDWVPGIGGKSVGFNLSQMTAPKIPYLATGAVIPPNSPFVAMLGDQKKGTNIETPERLLRQIMREELGNRQTSAGTYKFIGQINRRVLFEEMITEAKLRQNQNGRNPFELA